MKDIELLAPANDKQTALAAIDGGCDAIYIGAQNFGARKVAGNSISDIKEIVDYAHKFYVKVHVTINTILTESELLEAQKLIEELYKIGVDAIIIQDMGILNLAVEGKLPPIPIHISTQCDNRTLKKVKFFDDIGVSRVILARELSISEIKDICKNTNCEIETFIHGALCVSYSGQCYLSFANGGRSANRGECAQCCRKKYTLINDKGKIIAKNKYLLNLKDFNASKHLKNLIDSGVKSFKIEGRLKDINYVKNVVSFYRNEINKFTSKTSSGKVFTDFIPDINKTFNRNYTNYFLENRTNCFNFNSPKFVGEKVGKISKIGKNFVEITSNIEFHPQDGLCYFENDKINGFLVNKVEGIKGASKIYPAQMPEIKVGTDIFRNVDSEFNKKLETAKFKRQIKVNFEFKNNELIAIDEDKNEVKILLLENETPKNYEKMVENFENQLKKTGESDFYVEKIQIGDNLPFLPISKINEYRREILEKLMAERITNYKKDVQKPLKYAEFPCKEYDYRANVHNETAKNFYKNCNCKITEMSVESTHNCKEKELMRTKHCLKYAFNMCKSPDKLFLIDEKGKKYKLNFDCKNCEMTISQ